MISIPKNTKEYFFFVSMISFVLLSHVSMYFEVQLTIRRVLPVSTHSHPVTRNRTFNLENEPCTKNMEAGNPQISIASIFEYVWVFWKCFSLN